MKLHEDKDAFGLLLENIHEKTVCPSRFRGQ